jgi:translation elongation factor EF-Tu-like GTPase
MLEHHWSIIDVTKFLQEDTNREDFRHRSLSSTDYITQPTVTAEDQLIKAIEDLSSALRRRVNTKGNEEMGVLRKMNEILSGLGKENGETKAQEKK